MWRAAAFFGFVGLFTLVFLAGTAFEHTPDGARDLVDEFMETIEGIDGVGIFLHNTALALPMFVPGFGVFWGLFSGWTTGVVFAALAVLEPQAAGLDPLMILFTTPFGVMELTAYSLAGSRSLLLAVALIRRRASRLDVRNTLAEAAVAAGLLLAAGLVEHQMIEMVREMGAGPPGL